MSSDPFGYALREHVNARVGPYFTAEVTYKTHNHSWTPAGMRKCPEWQYVQETWEALLVCTCGAMEWRKAPPR